VTAEHAAVIAANADALVAFGPEIAKGFYDTLYGHGPTEEIFHEGERPMREQTLIGWWERTARGPIDDDDWAWMAMVRPDPRRTARDEPDDARDGRLRGRVRQHQLVPSAAFPR